MLCLQIYSVGLHNYSLLRTFCTAKNLFLQVQIWIKRYLSLSLDESEESPIHLFAQFKTCIYYFFRIENYLEHSNSNMSKLWDKSHCLHDFFLWIWIAKLGTEVQGIANMQKSFLRAPCLFRIDGINIFLPF